MNTTYFLNLVAGNVFGTKNTPKIPTTYYIGLSTTAPGIDGTNVTEPSASYGYRRIQLTSMSAPANGIISNTATIDFPESTGRWGVVTHFVIYESASGGQLLMYGPLTNPRTVEAATLFAFKTGSLKLSVVNPTA